MGCVEWGKKGQEQVASNIRGKQELRIKDVRRKWFRVGNVGCGAELQTDENEDDVCKERQIIAQANADGG